MAANPIVPWRNWKLIAICAVGAAMLGLGLFVPRATNSDAASKVDGPNITAMLLRLIAATVVVLALCGGVTWMVSRHRRIPNMQDADGALQIVDALNVGGRCRVHLVRVGDSWMLVGVDATGLKTVLPLAAEPDALAELAKAA